MHNDNDQHNPDNNNNHHTNIQKHVYYSPSIYSGYSELETLDDIERKRESSSISDSYSSESELTPRRFFPKSRTDNLLIRMNEDLRLPLINYQKLDHSSRFITLPTNLDFGKTDYIRNNKIRKIYEMENIDLHPPQTDLSNMTKDDETNSPLTTKSITKRSIRKSIKPLRVVIRRKSCYCSDCGGIAQKEKKLGNIPFYYPFRGRSKRSSTKKSKKTVIEKVQAQQTNGKLGLKKENLLGDNVTPKINILPQLNLYPTTQNSKNASSGKKQKYIKFPLQRGIIDTKMVGKETCYGYDIDYTKYNALAHDKKILDKRRSSSLLLNMNENSGGYDHNDRCNTEVFEAGNNSRSTSYQKHLLSDDEAKANLKGINTHQGHGSRKHKDFRAKQHSLLQGNQNNNNTNNQNPRKSIQGESLQKIKTIATSNNIYGGSKTDRIDLPNQNFENSIPSLDLHAHKTQLQISKSTINGGNDIFLSSNQLRILDKNTIMRTYTKNNDSFREKSRLLMPNLLPYNGVKNVSTDPLYKNVDAIDIAKESKKMTKTQELLMDSDTSPIRSDLKKNYYYTSTFKMIPTVYNLNHPSQINCFGAKTSRGTSNQRKSTSSSHFLDNFPLKSEEFNSKNPLIKSKFTIKPTIRLTKKTKQHIKNYIGYIPPSFQNKK